jgi:transposase InsO family protein
MGSRRRRSTAGAASPGKPVENAYVESFHSRFRDECLSAQWFDTFTDARFHIERWRQDYHEVRPHTSLAGRTPNEFAMTLKKSDPITRLSA